MKLFKEAGGNCIATYVPWLIHETVEGEIVFGEGQLDLAAFLDAALEEELYVIARPGPYQYSELKYDGLPGWLCENYPELAARDVDGNPFRTSSVSYLHPLFLEKAERWLKAACAVIAPRTVAKGGPVAFVQIDNELTGVHTWFAGPDWHPVSMGLGEPGGRFPCFLRDKYGTVDVLNKRWGESLGSFEEAKPIRVGPSSDAGTIRRMKDCWDFYLGTVAEYAKILMDILLASGIDTPIIHNSANPNNNAYFLEMVEMLGENFLLGSDHYYTLGQDWDQNNPTPQYAVNIFYSHETLRLMGYPPTIMELPGGSSSDWPPLTARDLRACYLTNVAFGMKGSNYYIYTGGPNLPGTGTTSDIYDYGAPVGPFGEIRPTYEAIKEFGLFMKARPWLAESHREYDCRFALDFEYLRASNYWQDNKLFELSPSVAWDFFRKGALTTALCASLSPVLCDLRNDDWLEDIATPVYVIAASTMARDKQERIVRFLKRGGKVLLGPVIPAYDENLEPCCVLSKFLGAPAVEKSGAQFVRVTVGEIANIHNNGDVFYSALPANAVQIGTDEVCNRTVAWTVKTEGDGEVLFLGFRWSHSNREQEQMLVYLMEKLNLERRVYCSNPNVWTSLRTVGRKSMLFIMNLLTASMETKVQCRPEWSGDLIDKGKHELEGMSVKTIEL